MKNIIIGLDIGGTKTEALLVDDALTAQAQWRQPTRKNNPEGLLSSLLVSIETVLAKASVQADQVAGIGVGIPGQVDPETGVVQTAVNLNLDHFPLGQRLSKTVGVPVFVDNDMHTAAVGTLHYLNSHEQPITSLAYLGIGTGIAAGIILNGKLHSGQHQMAGEIGHVVFQDDGPLCKCGQHGCLEAIASGPAIVKQANKLLNGHTITSPQELYELAAQDYFPAQLAVTRISKSLARAIQLLLMTYDVEKVILGGGVSRLGSQLLHPIIKELNTLQRHSQVAQKMLDPTKISIIPHDFNPGLWGAIHLAHLGLHKEVTNNLTTVL